jgi:glycosyltransferase involved in cell wall biosynthesis
MSTKAVLIIPALNEEAAIAAVVCGVPAGVVDEIIVVDNGSSDGTAERAAAAGARVVREPERGYGAAMMAGVEAAPDAGAYVFIDGDHADDPGQIAVMLAALREGRAGLALGVRDGSVEAGAMFWHQRAGNRVIVWMIGRISRRRLRDVPSLKAIDGGVLRRLDLRERTHGWTAELIAKAAMRGVPIVEIECGYRRRIGVSKVSGSARGSVLAAWRITAAIVRVWRTERLAR